MRWNSKAPHMHQAYKTDLVSRQLGKWKPRLEGATKNGTGHLVTSSFLPSLSSPVFKFQTCGARCVT